MNHNATSKTNNLSEKGAGDTVIVTGASGSIGAEVVKSLLQKNFSVIMACRDLEKGNTVRNEILKEFKGKENVVSLEKLDMSSFSSIRQFVDKISNKNIQLYGLMNNAGTINRGFQLTNDGVEETIAVNYLGIVLLTEVLLPMLDNGARITNVISMTTNPKRITKDMFEYSPKKYRQLRNYGQSKTALLLYTAMLSEKTKGKIHVNAADPGIVDTNILKLDRWFDPLADLLFRPLVKSPGKGAIPLVNALLAEETGKIFLGNSFKSISGDYVKHPLRDWFLENSLKHSHQAAEETK
ncbi:MAG: SDR family NAD(P)-dependent oxidoreductase [Porphyromonadaceae bacterium]|nr:SDR family NAD(P)-dependent oxidoreductase [Porphyromonadaceae bacterium]